MKKVLIPSLLIIVFIGFFPKNSLANISDLESDLLHKKIELNASQSVEDKIAEVKKRRLTILGDSVISEKFSSVKKFLSKQEEDAEDIEKECKSETQCEMFATKGVEMRERKYNIMEEDSKGIWVNVWNYPNDVEAFMDRMKKYKFDTIYLQINRSTTPIFKHKEKLDEILRVAHKKRIRIIGWSYCYLHDVDTDVKKFIEPALYVSPDGERLDGMAADIEENTSLVAVQRYTELVRSKLPKGYPMLAIVFAPRIKPKYPWKYIGDNWDVLMPMTYWHGIKYRTTEDVFNFIKHTAHELRRLTGKENLMIHLITDGERTTADEVLTSLKAAKEFNINAGVSLYPEHLAPEDILEVMKNFRCC